MGELLSKLAFIKHWPKPIQKILIGSVAIWVCGSLILLGVSLFYKKSSPESASTSHHEPSPTVVTDSVSHEANKTHSAEKTTAEVHSEATHVVAETEEIKSNPAVLLRLIELYLKEGEFIKAVPYVNEAAPKMEHDPEFLSQAVRIYFAAGEFIKAEEMASKGLSHDSSSLEFWRIRGMSLFRLGEQKKAITWNQLALKRFPDQMDLLVDLGTMEVEMGPTFEHYGQTLNKALNINPASLSAIYLQGRKFALEGNYSKAETSFRALLQKDSTHAKAWAQLGIALYQSGKIIESGHCMIAALRHNPKDYNSWYNLGEWYTDRLQKEGENAPETGKILREKALRCYLNAAELNTDHAEAHFRIGLLLHGNGQFNEAIRHFQASINVDSTFAPAWLQMGVAYQRLKLEEQARLCVRKAFELDPLNRLVIAKLRELS